MQLGAFTTRLASIFNIRSLKVLPYEFPDDIHMSISYEFDLDFYKIDRSTYNSFDWFSDVGGLHDGLVIIFGLIYSLFHF